MEPQDHEVTELLNLVRIGDKTAENKLYELVMPHLRRIAQSLISKERPHHTLQGTELVNRMYLRLSGAQLSLRDRKHFFAIAARAMRRELIDYARGRPNAVFIPIDALPEGAFAGRNHQEIALIVDELLSQMAETMPLEASIVELKFFLGLTDEETAEVLEIPLRTMQLRWQNARIWLFERAEAQQWKPIKPKSSTTTN